MDAKLTKWDFAKQYLPFDADEALVYDRVMSGHAQLWLGKCSSGVTEVTDENCLHIWKAGGSLKELTDMLPDVIGFAKAMGCVGVEAGGRKGWLRALQRYGFKPHKQGVRYGWQ